MLTPIITKFHTCADDIVASLDDILECCDSTMAILSKDQIDEWMSRFDSIIEDDDVDYADGTATMVFDIDGQYLVVVSDSGGEFASGDFYEFCENLHIDAQTVVDSIDCTDISVDEIYTGQMEDNEEILSLLHKVFNSEMVND